MFLISDEKEGDEYRHLFLHIESLIGIIKKE
jgi:hypothetical protein